MVDVVIKSKRMDPSDVGFRGRCAWWRFGWGCSWVFVNEGPLRKCRAIETIPNVVCNEKAAYQHCGAEVLM